MVPSKVGQKRNVWDLEGRSSSHPSLQVNITGCGDRQTQWCPWVLAFSCSPLLQVQFSLPAAALVTTLAPGHHQMLDRRAPDKRVTLHRLPSLVRPQGSGSVCWASQADLPLAPLHSIFLRVTSSLPRLSISQSCSASLIELLSDMVLRRISIIASSPLQQLGLWLIAPSFWNWAFCRGVADDYLEGSVMNWI